MAVIDYGAILVKNGKIVNKNIFSMEKTDNGYKIPYNISFYVACGDEKFCLAFFKRQVYVIINGVFVGTVWIDEVGNADNDQIFIKMPYEKRLNLFDSGISVTFEAIDHDLLRDAEYGYRYYSGKYHTNFTYDGNVYDIYFGYGIDSDEEIYNKIKFTSYDYTEKERNVMDKVFEIG